MKISSKGRYGLRAMIDLAIHSNGGYVSLKSIAKRQKISVKYLEHSFSVLKKAGLIAGLTGPHGGYKLNHDPDKIMVKMILKALEGDLSITESANPGDETVLQRCVRKNVWDKIDERVDNIVGNATLKDFY